VVLHVNIDQHNYTFGWLDPEYTKKRIFQRQCPVCWETSLLYFVYITPIQACFKSKQQFHISAKHFQDCKSYTLTVSLYTYSAECHSEVPV